MSPTKSSLLLLILLAALGAGGAAWFLFDDSIVQDTPELSIRRAPDRPVDVAEDVSQRALAQPTNTAASETAEVETAVIHPLEIDLALVQLGTFQRVDGLLPIGSGRRAAIKGNVFGPDAHGASATLTFVGGPNDGRVLHTDSSGAYGASDLYGGLDVIDIRTTRGGLARREVRLREGAEEIMTVSFYRPASVYGSVKDRAGAALAGVRVSLDAQEAFSDDLGEFHFPQVASGKALLILDKPGYALYREVVPIAMGSTVPKDRLTFTLVPAAALEVHVQESLGARTPAQLYLIPSGGQRINTTSGQRTFPWHRVNPIEIYPGGSALIEQLPEGSVNMMLFHSGAVAKPRQARIKLTAGRKRSQILHLEPAPVIRGRAERDGKPAAGVVVQLESPNRNAATYDVMQKRSDFNQGMVLRHMPAALQEVRTDESGRFTFTAYPSVSSGYYLTAKTADGEWSANTVVEASDEELVVKLKRMTDTSGAIRFKLPGRSQGLPVQVRVQGSPRDPLLLAAGDDLVIDGLERGLWRFDALWNGEALRQGQTLTLENEAVHRIELPAGAIHGQTPEERRRAGK